ncbi:reverse transcriptase family protein [Undibacterium sp. TS12]|uniref:reverse transcriptase family protein n=1 Tax=Undibacterium sp. TS12 TaxID=2908202 RepID=UPI001F4C5CE0|nr:reverse transcriptase family protein [Undibacterium sp. TS12]MCH8623011.1 reverse transcriptase family protein [Undibacterium sp. TS12]
MTKTKLVDLKTLEHVAQACGVSAEFIVQYANDQRQRDYYFRIKIPKRGKNRNRQFRIVFQAKEYQLASLHRSVAMIIANSVQFGEQVQGFRKKRSSRSNAQQHLAKAVILHADIKSFFDSITTEQVHVAFVSQGVSNEIAQLLAKACTIEGLLRQGTRCSPILANLVCAGLDNKLLALAHSCHSVFTRYADDLTFSGDQVPSSAAVKTIVESEGFTLRDDKCKLQRQGRCQYVTGLTVSDGNMPRLPRRLKSRLRLIFHYIEKNGLTEHWQKTGQKNGRRKEQWLDGMLQYAASIEPDLANKWQDILTTAKVQKAATARQKYFVDCGIDDID